MNRDFLNKLCFLLLIYGMGLYTVKLFLSPIYIACGLAIICFTCYIFFGGEVRLRADAVLAFFGMLYVLAVSNAIEGAFINLSLGLFGYIILASTLWKIDSIYLYKNVIKASWLIVIILIIDAGYRFANPTVPTLEELSFYEQSNSLFYLYKFNSLMFADSNTSGLLGMQIFFLVLGFSHFYKKENKILLSFLFLAILLSISRAAILATILSFFLVYFTKNKYFYRLIPLMLICVGLTAIGVYIYFFDDPSNQERFSIFLNAKDYIFHSASLMELFFGIGLGNSIEVINQAAHNILLTYFLELGGIGFLVFFTFFASVSFLEKEAFKYVILPAFIAGLSYYMYAGTPFLFIPIALIVEISIRNREIS